MVSFHPCNNHRAELRLKTFEARNYTVQRDLGVCPPNAANKRHDNPHTRADSKTATSVIQNPNPNLTQTLVRNTPGSQVKVGKKVSSFPNLKKRSIPFKREIKLPQVLGAGELIFKWA